MKVDISLTHTQTNKNSHFSKNCIQTKRKWHHNKESSHWWWRRLAKQDVAFTSRSLYVSRCCRKGLLHLGRNSRRLSQWRDVVRERVMHGPSLDSFQISLPTYDVERIWLQKNKTKQKKPDSRSHKMTRKRKHASNSSSPSK